MDTVNMNDDLLRLVTDFAWGQRFSRAQLELQLDCCIDCQANIPVWFLDDVIYFFPCPGKDPPFWSLKMFNPLVAGAPFSPFDIRNGRLNTRSCTWLRRAMLRKPLYRLWTCRCRKRGAYSWTSWET